MLSADKPAGKAPVGLNTVKNDRRRAMEGILVLLADPGFATIWRSWGARARSADRVDLGFL
jgi:hypothetical protein